MRLPSALAAMFAVLLPLVAHAQTDAARASYDRASAAYEAGDFATAAREYARADELAANDVALRWALNAAVKANDAVLGMNLVHRSDSRSDPPADLIASAGAARDAFSARVGSLTLACPAGQACTVEVDGTAVPIETKRYYAPGKHQVVFSVAGQSLTEWVEIAAGGHESWTAKAVAVEEAPPPEPVSAEQEGILPLSWQWPVVCAIFTAGLGAAAVWSGVDTLDRNDDYLASRDEKEFEDGMAAQDRTNILIATAAIAGAGTLVFGLLAIDWSPQPEAADSAWDWLVSPRGVGVRF